MASPTGTKSFSSTSLKETRDGPSETMKVLEVARNPVVAYLAEKDALPSEGPSIPWRDYSDMSHVAAGGRDFLYIVSNVSTTDNPDIVPRRSRGPLTEEERRKLEEQGVHRDMQHTDLSIMTARAILDERCTIDSILPKEKMNCTGVMKEIAQLMNNTSKEGVVLCYIGPGKKGTGDWCFSDGFISFREIMDLYTQHFRRHVLTISSDCSYSGSWVREAMTFMDEQGVGPCGHVAKEKGILVKVFASCLANEIPAELAFSTHCAGNHLISKELVLNTPDHQSTKIHEDQHTTRLDFTQVQCKNKINQPCTMAPGSTWEQWKQWIRLAKLYTVRGIDKGEVAWSCIILNDDDETIETFSRIAEGSETELCLTDYGEIVKSGYGEAPTHEVLKKEILDYDYTP